MADARRSEPGGRSVAQRYSLPLAIALTALLAVSLIRNGAAGSRPPQPSGGGAPVSGPGPGPPPPPLRFAVPARVRIPALGVDAPVTTVGSDGKDGIAAPPPTDRNLAGWYGDAPSPGEQGTAVLDGHVDTMRGPAVFYGLGALRTGNTVDVLRSDGRTAVFTVYGVEVFAKRTFPGERVYHDTGRPELRVITCGGGFTKAGGYDSDVVVFAAMTAVR